jgi:hypothetical protein
LVELSSNMEAITASCVDLLHEHEPGVALGQPHGGAGSVHLVSLSLSKIFPQVLDMEEVGLQLRQGLGQDVDLGADHEGALQLHFRQSALPAFSISWLTVSLGAMVR